MTSLSLDQVECKLKAIIAEIKRLPVNSIALSKEDDFLAMYDLSSMDAVSLSIEINQIFGFGFGESIDDIDSLVSFGALTKRIYTMMAKNADAG